MKILLIPDKFKGSASAKEVVAALIKGIKRAVPHANIKSFLASDGGDGFLDAVFNYIDAEEVKTKTFDPLGRPITASYLLNKENKSAYIEMAKASGMELLTADERNPMDTTTFGTGVLIKNAVSQGANKIYVGLGGSATNDGGVGMAKALGYGFKDHSGETIDPIGKNLINIQSIESKSLERYLGVSFYAVNDVQNPLYGKQGAAYVYAKQKGASDADIEDLDAGLVHLSKIVKEQLNKDIAHVSGAGAAGGLGYGLKTFLNAEYVVGIEFLLGLAKIPQLLKKQKIDYIITGEGKIDGQTLNGKLIKGVVDMGKQHKIPVLGVCGKLDIDKKELFSLGLHDALEISEASKSLNYNMSHAPELIENAIYMYFQDMA
ncbi:glycerate kinase [Saonia flava]|uniref:Glycerate kinase n=1 Tax=Saonia flava TaxID=523696 RepID=A0A846QVG0_9FLAO|nr:glycerate kinase [Saonia flava]NJB70562.1 glycerate kinase [Saonia flava]